MNTHEIETPSGLRFHPEPDATVPFLRQPEAVIASAGPQPGSSLYLSLHRSAMERLIKHRKAKLTPDQLAAGVEHVKELTGIVMKPLQLADILEISPSAKMHLAAFGEFGRQFNDALGSYFLGCAWPTEKEVAAGIDLRSFLSILRRQAEAMGYKLHKA